MKYTNIFDKAVEYFARAEQIDNAEMYNLVDSVLTPLAIAVENTIDSVVNELIGGN